MNIQPFSLLESLPGWFDTVYNIVTLWMNFRKKQLHGHEVQLSDYDVFGVKPNNSHTPLSN